MLQFSTEVAASTSTRRPTVLKNPDMVLKLGQKILVKHSRNLSGRFAENCTPCVVAEAAKLLPAEMAFAE